MFGIETIPSQVHVMSLLFGLTTGALFSEVVKKGGRKIINRYVGTASE